ncbi:hypothetical protein G6O69_21600 [Pseudenhygromyxa sp. WMMC2535]|uniref:hypothetical protein n=1 Tax=Pseudenhygromyxa sp. WMMC2535 TaxID=2712867 RepID=UPI0015521443|nr:hypothetical protein [Pseudenhygromyxa sp. WMMC2535]NVB40450.1 hypothetical protein [Pseudenhygromyxa sp. WMMC2535]
MTDSSARFKVLTWQDFDEFWQALEASHEETPYTFDAYDEEVARIAFKAGRESMRRQIVAMLEHMIEVQGSAAPTIASRREAQSAVAEVGRAVLRELVDDVDAIIRAEDN